MLNLFKVVEGKKVPVTTDGTLKSIFTIINKKVPNGFWEGTKNGFIIYKDEVPMFVTEVGA